MSVKTYGSIAQKMVALGFDPESLTHEETFEELLDLLLDFQEWTKDAGEGKPSGDELNICASIH